jgi:hypothetical protein
MAPAGPKPHYETSGPLGGKQLPEPGPLQRIVSAFRALLLSLPEAAAHKPDRRQVPARQSEQGSDDLPSRWWPPLF